MFFSFADSLSMTTLKTSQTSLECVTLLRASLKMKFSVSSPHFSPARVKRKGTAEEEEEEMEGSDDDAESVFWNWCVCLRRVRHAFKVDFTLHLRPPVQASKTSANHSSAPARVPVKKSGGCLWRAVRMLLILALLAAVFYYVYCHVLEREDIADNAVDTQ